MLILVLVLLLVYPVECVRVRGARGEEKAATAEELPPEGGDSPPAAPPLRARNKTTVTVAVAPHKVGRLSVPNAEKGMTLSRIAYGSLHFPEFEGTCAGSGVGPRINPAGGAYSALWGSRQGRHVVTMGLCGGGLDAVVPLLWAPG